MNKNNLMLKLSNVIMNDDTLHEIEDMANEKILLQKHPYDLTQLPNGRWQSYFKADEKSKRLCVRAPSRKQLIDKLAAMYCDTDCTNKITFSMLFEEWLEYKKQFVSSNNTIIRHQYHYDKYFKNAKLSEKMIINIDQLELEALCNRTIKDNKMTRKEWTNVKTILLGMFNYAVRKKYIAVNPMSGLEIKVKFRQTAKKHGSQETFNPDERKRLNDYLDKMYQETFDSVFMAVKVNLMLGLRVSELVALQWGDIVDNNKLHVVRGEVRDQTSGTYTVVGHTKVYKDRYVDIPDPAVEIFQELKKKSKHTCDSDYIFVREGKRLNARKITYALERYASRNKLEVKRSHKLRKTYASVLATNGIPIDEIRQQLGHSNLQTTMAYIFNPLAEEETHRLISSAFS